VYTALQGVQAGRSHTSGRHLGASEAGIAMIEYLLDGTPIETEYGAPFRSYATATRAIAGAADPSSKSAPREALWAG
jgi:hypothetical protein